MSKSNGSSSLYQKLSDSHITGQGLVQSESRQGVTVVHDDCFSSDDKYQDEYRVYPLRWLMLFAFALLSSSNSMLWVAYSPIADDTREYYRINRSQFNWLSMAFYLTYLPFCVIGMVVLKRYGLRQAMIFSSALNGVAAIVRCLSGESIRYGMSLVGSALGGAACAIFLGVPSNLANVWFGENERALSAGIAVAANQIGIAFGFLFSPVIVKNGPDVKWLNVVVAGYCGVAFLVIAAVFKSKPPTPPSDTAESSEIPFRESFDLLRRDRHAWVIGGVFALATGCFWAFSALLGEIFQAYGYTSSQCGVLGVVFLSTGLGGDLLAGYLVDRTHAYKTLGAICFGATAGIFVLTTSFYKDGSMAAMAVIVGALGFFQSALLPILLELTVDSTFPASEAVSGTALMLFAQFGALAATFAATALTKQPSGDMTDVLWLFTAVNTVCLLVFVLGFHGTYARHQFELNKEKALVEDAKTSTIASSTPPAEEVGLREVEEEEATL